MPYRSVLFTCLISVLSPAATAAEAAPPPPDAALEGITAAMLSDNARDFLALFEAIGTLQEGRRIFRHDTFGDEAFWTDALGLDRAIRGEALGGVGPGLDPATALSLGLKVDSTALPPSLIQAIGRGEVDLADPATTVALLQLDAVVGVKGTFDDDQMVAVGLTCALCHSTVDDAIAPGIGRRLDGWANRDLDPGAIIALAPDLSPLVDLLRLADPEIDEDTVRTVLRSWGPGRFDASLLIDGKAFRPDGESASTLIPPAFGLAGINLHTWTGWGGVAHWNAFVATLEMGGQGTFVDSRLNDAEQFPIAAAAGFANVRTDNDLVTSKLPALHLFQLSLEPPVPPAGSFDAAAAERGQALFNDKAGCADCHVPPLFTEPGWNLHPPEDIGIDSFQADRSPNRGYRTSPLRGLWTHTDGGFYHDGRFTTLADVVAHYDGFFDLGLTGAETADLVEYLKSL